MKVLITRPKDQSEHLLKELKRQGYQTELLPLLDIQPVVYSERQKREWLQQLRQADFIISISANAARLSLNLLNTLKIDKNPDQLMRLYAIGSATAEVFSDAGFVARIPAGGYNSESLLQLPDFDQLKDRKVVILCGEGGRDYLEQKLYEKGALVTRVELYQRTPIGYDQLAVDQLSFPDVLTAMSGDTVNALASTIESGEPGAMPLWKQLPLVVPSERVARVASERSFTKIYISEKPTTDSLLAVLGQLQKGV